MSATPPRKTEGKQAATGLRLLGVAAVLCLIGVAIALIVDRAGTPNGIGVAFMALGSVPAVAGLVLIGAAYISRRSRQGRDWA
jgi:hypothetical protein